MRIYLMLVFLATLFMLTVQIPDSMKNGAEEVMAKGNLSVPRFPPDGYQYFPSAGYYKLDGRRENFENAVKICENDGAHLAIINSFEQAFAIFTVFRPYYGPGVGGVRLGFGDFYGKGDFRTIFGEPINTTGYLHWYPGMPSTPYERNCGFMNIEDKLLIDCCDCDRYFVCEIDLPSTDGPN